MNPSRRIPIYTWNNNWILMTNKCSLIEGMFIHMRMKAQKCTYLTNNYFVKFELMKHYILMERLFLSQKLGEIKACTLVEPFLFVSMEPTLL